MQEVPSSARSRAEELSRLQGDLSVIQTTPEKLGRQPTDLHMTNFDHTIDDGFKEVLLDGYYGQHAAWNFCGYVWFAEGFHEEVWRYNSPVEIITAASLPELMEAVNRKYGDD